MQLLSVATTVTASALAALSALHVAWGLGSSFPCADRTELADVVAGSSEVPPPGACYAVATALSGAAVLVAGAAPLPSRWRRTALVGVAAVLGGRGVLGLGCGTARIVPWRPSERFTTLDRRYYGPLCIALSAGALAARRDR